MFYLMSVTQSDNETGSWDHPPPPTHTQIVGAGHVGIEIIRYRDNDRSFWQYPDYIGIIIWIPTSKYLSRLINQTTPATTIGKLQVYKQLLLYLLLSILKSICKIDISKLTRIYIPLENLYLINLRI